MSWTSGLRIRPYLLHIAPLLAIAGLTLAGCSKDDEPTPGPGTTTFVGVAAGSGISGSLSVTVGTATPAPAGVTRIARPARTVTATGTFTPAGGSAVNLAGTYDDESNALVVTGGGYSFTGLYANEVLAGTFVGSGPVDGVFSMQAGAAGSVTTYCGSYNSLSGGSGGTFNLAVGATTLSGVGYDLGTETSFPLIGTIDVDDSVHISLAGQPPVPIAEGKVSADGSIVAGVYDDGQGDNGTWSGELCSVPPPPTSFRGVAAGHAESGGLELSVSSTSAGPHQVAASGNYRIAGAVPLVISLTGTYNTVGRFFDLSGSGYQFVGPYESPGRQRGIWISAASEGGWVTAAETASLSTYCGTFESNTTTETGHLGVVLNGGIASGVAVATDPSGDPIPLDGIVAGSNVTMYFPGTSTVFATGVIATGGASITGTYDNHEGDQGDWTATLCPAPPPAVATRLQWGTRP